MLNRNKIVIKDIIIQIRKKSLFYIVLSSGYMVSQKGQLKVAGMEDEYEKK